MEDFSNSENYKIKENICLEHKIRELALQQGFDDVGIIEAKPLEKHFEILCNWLSENKNADMHYMKNNLELRENIKNFFPDAQSVIIFIHNYFPKNKFDFLKKYKIAYYAYGRDYHKVLAKKLKKIISDIKQLAPDCECRSFTDSAPVMEKVLAEKAGLGWIGKNSLLINRKLGSYFFISGIVTNLKLNYNTDIEKNRCGNCRNCIDACPTKAIEKPYIVNSNLCISYHTIENKNEIPEKLGNSEWIFGCDICQQVCPWNRKAKPNNEKDFSIKNELLELNDSALENLTEAEFDKLFEGSPIKRTKFEGLKRNIFFVKNENKL